MGKRCRLGLGNDLCRVGSDRSVDLTGSTLSRHFGNTTDENNTLRNGTVEVSEKDSSFSKKCWKECVMQKCYKGVTMLFGPITVGERGTFIRELDSHGSSEVNRGK